MLRNINNNGSRMNTKIKTLLRADTVSCGEILDWRFGVLDYRAVDYVDCRDMEMWSLSCYLYKKNTKLMVCR